MDTTVSSPFTASADAPVDTATVSFWQAVVDAKSNRSYYWNPATNEVSWTLPPNSVISNEQPVPALTGTGEAAAGAPVGGSLQDYYAYYSQQIYGVDASNPGQGATAVEEVKDNNTQVKKKKKTLGGGFVLLVSCWCVLHASSDFYFVCHVLLLVACVSTSQPFEYSSVMYVIMCKLFL